MSECTCHGTVHHHPSQGHLKMKGSSMLGLKSVWELRYCLLKNEYFYVFKSNQSEVNYFVDAAWSS